MNPISQELADLLAPRILARVQESPDGCWIRTVGVNYITGYTSIQRTLDRARKYYYAHRVMYVSANGPIPEGLTVDHLCNVQACCNPAHLRAVPHYENVIRAENNYFSINARKTHCIRGHKLPPYVVGGRRRCLTCRNAGRARRRAERAA